MEGHRGDTQRLPWASTCMCVLAHTQKKHGKRERAVWVQQTLKKRRPKQGDATVYPTHGKASAKRWVQTKEPQAWLHRAYPGTQPGKPSRRTQESRRQGYALFSYWSSDMSKDAVYMHEHMTQNCKGVQVIQNHAMNRNT